MEIQVKLNELKERIEQLKDKIPTEEGTKHSFILPFFSLLGYDTYNPTEVFPEFTADIGTKKGEKVDYAIFQNGEPILIVECKHWKENLDIHNSQLFRYFNATKTRFALLTNGINYRFYTDLEETNKMDEKPFLEFDITKINERTIKEIEKFHKSKFNESSIFDNASNLKYTREIKSLINQEISAPSHEFIRHFASKAYNGRLTSKVMEEFTDIVNKAFNQIIGEKVNDRLNAALNKEQEKQQQEEEKEEEINSNPKNKIDTTDEELEAYQIVVAILRRKIGKELISHRDTQSYFGILYENTNRQPICRLHLNGGVKYLSLFHKNKEEEKVKIDSIDDIYNYEKELLETIDYYDSLKKN